jgi:hypothetical protein
MTPVTEWFTRRPAGRAGKGINLVDTQDKLRPALAQGGQLGVGCDVAGVTLPQTDGYAIA